MLEKRGRVWLEIDLAILKDNYRKIKETVDPCEVMAVLKANAYGLGVERVAKALAESGVKHFGVAELNEALALARNGLRTQIIGSVLPEEVPSAVDAGIVLPVTDYEIAAMISAAAVRMNKKAECHIKVDTGMGRLGILADQAVEEVKKIAALPGLDLGGIYSHFPIAYLAGGDFTQSQVSRFLRILDELKSVGINFRWLHIANSDAINNVPVTCLKPFNLVRSGINLYGTFDLVGKHILKLRSILTLKTQLAAIRQLPAGMAIGYGQTYRLHCDTRVGTVSAGYADGLPLALSNRGYVLIHGKPCPILGRLSMDYTTVSLESVPEAKRGDEVVCLGGEGVNAIGVEDWATLKGTHPYDIICSFGSRVKRVYHE